MSSNVEKNDFTKPKVKLFDTQCLKIRKKPYFTTFVKNTENIKSAKITIFGAKIQIVEKMAKIDNGTFLVIFKHCAYSSFIFNFYHS